ncbi:MerR family transcriptional regulator [Cytobacillus purgationiresistens]|uniref:DNA-binding transcriptional MerR regulator n=1 Tax=Cytobacillus purgationiresistens TaxID=863449 RepID=A0ABU0AR37_9BACI|nr:MerR family transcriptional regulator [Cytobacillus purgationiresistens]MDQ0273334.1 DNA-binding transcriptional MerR regulator [Cytobacillus purgationiresistens]
MDIGKAILRIGQVAKLSGLTSRTIDYYTQCNLLHVERSSSNYRLYPEDVLKTLKRIKYLKQQRMSISEIQRIIHQQDTQGVETIVIEVQDEIDSLKRKLNLWDEKLKEFPKDEKQRVFSTLEDELTNLMKLLTLL